MNLKRTAVTLFLLAIIAVLSAWNYHKLVKIFFPCKEPISYRLGTFDEQFGITEKDFLSALLQAEEIWEESIDRELFVHQVEGGDLVVNLVYDYRQETTETLSGLEHVVEENEATYNELEDRYAELKTRYSNAKDAFDARAALFNGANEDYQKLVESWNRGPRTSKKAFEELEQKKKSLQREASELESLETQLNGLVKEINSLVGVLNHLSNSLNLNVNEYNTIGASRGETFTGGMYYSDGAKQEIDIYEFSNREKLIRVLAHELGHALGLEHVDDPGAIMYYLNEGEAGKLSSGDLAALQALCYN